ncbi:MAG: helix-turn-helix transcriptional regulator [Verrucomicrobia bacterium]|nr:helix-turn-helix transcriptional regulator [Verrucomicrobiota bacterium]
MSESNIAPKAPLLSLAQVMLLLSDPARWLLMRELSRDQMLPVGELGRRIGHSPSNTSKHLLVLRRLGVVSVSYGRMYVLMPAFRPAPGTATIDFGHCVVRLDGALV